jgi:hypothetical protein
MLKKILKWVLIVAGIAFVGYIGFLFMIMSAFGAFDKDYTKQELIGHYEAKAAEIQELKTYFQSIVPANRTVSIEFTDDKELNIFHIITSDTATGKTVRSNNWNLAIKSSKVDSMAASLGWSRETLKTLKAKLDKAGCISVTNSSPFKIGFQRSGMGMYFYNLFDQPIPDSLQAAYNDGCTYVLYTDQVVLEYGGGAVGPQCFPW